MTSSGARSKQKGSSFERKICKTLSLWVTNFKNEDVFWRSAMSGGRATMGMRRGTALRRQSGDISSVAPEGHIITDKFFIELKHYKNLSVDSFFLTGKGALAGFWAEAVREAKKYGKHPLLIARQNNKPLLLMIGSGMEPALFQPKELPLLSITLQGSQHDCTVYLFDQVIEQTKPLRQRSTRPTPKAMARVVAA